MREYLVKAAYPDLLHPPNMIYAAFILMAYSPDNAANRTAKLILPGIKSMLRKLRTNPYTIDLVAEELLTITDVEEVKANEY